MNGKKISIILAAVALAGVVSGVSGERQGESFQSIIQSNLEKNPENGRCDLCKVFMDEMFKFVRDNRTEDTIRKGLDYVCKLFPKEQSEQCESMVYAYTKEIIEIIADETNPTLICTLLEQCFPRPVAPQPKMKQAESIGIAEFINMLEPYHSDQSAFACVECKLFVRYLQNELKDTHSQEELKDWLLKNLCGNLEDAAKNSCTKMVDDNSTAFFEAIAKNLDPTETCMDLNACPKRLLSLVLNNAPERPLFPDMSIFTQVLRPKVIQPSAMRVAKEPKSDSCSVCIDVVTRLDEYLSTNEVEHDIDVLTREICEKCPYVPWKKSCTKLIKTFGQEILSLVEIMDNPRDLCTKLTLC